MIRPTAVSSAYIGWVLYVQTRASHIHMRHMLFQTIHVWSIVIGRLPRRETLIDVWSRRLPLQMHSRLRLCLHRCRRPWRYRALRMEVAWRTCSSLLGGKAHRWAQHGRAHSTRILRVRLLRRVLAHVPWRRWIARSCIMSAWPGERVSFS